MVFFWFNRIGCFVDASISISVPLFFHSVYLVFPSDFFFFFLNGVLICNLECHLISYHVLSPSHFTRFVVL